MKRENKDAIELTRKELLARKPMTHDLTGHYKRRLYGKL